MMATINTTLVSQVLDWYTLALPWPRRDSEPPFNPPPCCNTSASTCAAVGAAGAAGVVGGIPFTGTALTGTLLGGTPLGGTFSGTALTGTALTGTPFSGTALASMPFPVTGRPVAGSTSRAGSWRKSRCKQILILPSLLTSPKFNQICATHCMQHARQLRYSPDRLRTAMESNPATMDEGLFGRLAGGATLGM